MMMQVMGILLLVILTIVSAKDETAAGNGRTSNNDTGESDVATVGQVSGYGVAQTLDFATTNITRPEEEVVAMSNGHQNGMLLMAMLLDNKSYIESESKPSLPIFDFNPEDIQDLDSKDFYSVDGQSDTNKTDIAEQPSESTNSDMDQDSLWSLPENPLTMPLVMADDGVKPNSEQFNAADSSSSLSGSYQEGTAANGDGNIYKVKLRRRMQANKRDRHRSISSQMNTIGNEVTTIKQFQTLTTMFDHWLWDAASIGDHVSKKCGAHMKTYLNGLRNGELWALKGNK